MAQLVFLGTKGEIEESSARHQYHASLLITAGDTRLLIDYGTLQKQRLDDIKPDVILITHAHPDHYIWLTEDNDTLVPVYLTQETFAYGRFKPRNAQIVSPGEELYLNPFHWSSYRVIHSIRAPAVGYKITVENKTLIYNPDLVDIVDKDMTMHNVSCYIGDGSSIKANLVRRRDDQLFGHTRITTQIKWCKDRQISSIYFTHLGKETIEKEDEFQTVHPDVVLAYDGMKVEI